jgi:preprotein translocase subunit SecG
VHTIILTLHILVAFALVIIVLLQTGKGATMGAAFGGSSQTLFGPFGTTTILSKLTTAAAIIFMLTSLSLAIISSKKEVGSIIERKGASRESAQETKPEIPPLKEDKGRQTPVTQ